MSSIFIKRVYEPAAKADGFRILVDRLWPRGLSKKAVAADVWMKEIAPSPALRKWFDHDPAKWSDFKKKYKAELKESDALRTLTAYGKKYSTISLLYGAKDEKHNQALVLQQLLAKALKK
jgi:uncharacterized protein YeaO (DUF488 family)